MGFCVLIVGLAVLGFGLFNHMKGKRILAAPFSGTGALAANPTTSDPKGAISVEGAITPPATPVVSPCTKTPCIYYEVKVERLWEKVETTQDGTKTVKGSDTIDTVKGGAIVKLDDGTGGIEVDFSKGADFDNFKETFKKELGGGGSSNVMFGQFRFDVPVNHDSEKYTIGFKATEKVVPVEGKLFVLGKLEGTRIIKPGWRSMMASSKGREGMLGSIAKMKKFSFIGGGIVTVLSLPTFMFAPSLGGGGKMSGSSCSSALTDAQVLCSDNVSSKSGDTFKWTVTKAGQYVITLHAPKKKVAFDPQVIVKAADGTVVVDESGGVGMNAVATADVQPGVYELTVKPADDYMVKGGFSYELDIAYTGGAAAPAPAMAPPPGEPAAPDEVAPAADAPVPAKKPIGKKPLFKKK